ncbi:AsmA-like C-terminal domain-containing protein [Desulfococcus sp.]|uniref:YhdP family protein n=1 Tax=Desulfococcus sp. TaxID=2025834 RepID=UPI0035936014
MNIYLKSALRWFYRFLVTLLIIGVLAIIWIRVQQPSLKFLDPHIQEAFRPMAPRYQVTYEDIRFAWPRGRLTPGIGITEARCLMNGDTLLARLPSITLRLSLSQLIRGRIEPTEIWLSRPRINLSGIARSAELPAGPAGWTLGSISNPEFLDDLFAFADRHADFKRLYATNGRLILPGDAQPVELELPNVVLSMLHVAPTPELILTAAYQFNGKPGRVQTVIHARPDKDADPGKISESKIHFTNLYPPILADLSPDLAFLRGLDFTANLEMLFRVDASGAVDNLRFEMESSGKGTLFHPEVWEAPLPLEKLTAKGWLKNAFSQLKLASLHLDAGGAAFDATGTIDNLGKFDAVSLDVRVDHLNPAEAHRYWPHRVVPGARKYIREHFLGGEIYDAAAKIRIQPSDLAAPVLPKGVIHARAPFRGVGMKYHGKLQPISDAEGTAVFTGHDITIDVAGARSYGSEAADGKVVIGNFTAPPATIDIHAVAKGPADDLRKVIESLTGQQDGSVKVGAGKAETRLAFQWPLSGFSQETFDYHAASRILGLDIPDFHGYRWTQKTLLVSLDRNAIAVSGTDGEAAPAADPKNAVPIQRVEARGELSYAPAGVEVNSFSADLGGPVLTFSGTATAAEPFPRVLFDGAVDNLPMALLLRSWPDRRAAPVKEWIRTHTSGGKIPRAAVRIDLDPAVSTLKDLPGSAVAVTGGFSGVALKDLSSLPPVTLEKGAFTLSADAARIRLESGQFGQSRIIKARADITGIRTDAPAIEIQSEIEGPASDLHDATAGIFKEKGDGLKLPPLKEARAKTRARFKFPIKKTLAAADVDHAVTADISDIVIKEYSGLTLHSGKASAALENGNFTLDGSISSGQTPVSVHWKRGGQTPETIKLSATVDPANHADFRLPPLPFLKGPVKADMALTVTEKGIEIDSRFDLTQPAIDLKRWGWVKKAGAKAALESRGTLTEGKTLTLSHLTLSGKNLDMRGTGTATLGEAAAFDLQFDPIKMGKQALSAGVAFDKQRGYRVDLKGDRFDAAGFFATRPPKEETAEPEGPPAADTPDKTPGPDITVSLDIRQAALANRITLDQPKGVIEMKGARIRSALIEGALNGKAPLHMSMNRKEAPEKILLTTEDAGAFLKGIDVYRNIRGGALTFDGRSGDMLPTKKPVSGKVEIRDFLLVNAPGLVKVLSMASFVGALGQLQRGGISFDALDADVAIENNVITLTNGRMEGISLAMTAEGTYDFAQRMSNIKGIVIPVNILNQMVDMIPVIGKMITGDGIIATDYTIKGPYKDPDVSIKPLTTLSVGFLRTVFKGIHLKAADGDPAGKNPAPSAPAKQGK